MAEISLDCFYHCWNNTTVVVNLNSLETICCLIFRLSHLNKSVPFKYYTSGFSGVDCCASLPQSRVDSFSAWCLLNLKMYLSEEAIVLCRWYCVMRSCLRDICLSNADWRTAILLSFYVCSGLFWMSKHILIDFIAKIHVILFAIRRM